MNRYHRKVSVDKSLLSGWNSLKSFASIAVYAARPSNNDFRFPEALESVVEAAHHYSAPHISRKASRRYKHAIPTTIRAKIGRSKPSRRRQHNTEKNEAFVRQGIRASVILRALLQLGRNQQQKADGSRGPSIIQRQRALSANGVPRAMGSLPVMPAPPITTALPTTTAVSGRAMGSLPVMPAPPITTALPTTTAVSGISNSEIAVSSATNQNGLGSINVGLDGFINSTFSSCSTNVLHKGTRTSLEFSRGDPVSRNTAVTTPVRNSLLGGRNCDSPQEQRERFEHWKQATSKFLGNGWDGAKIGRVLRSMLNKVEKNFKVQLTAFSTQTVEDIFSAFLSFLEFLTDKEFLHKLLSAWEAKELPQSFCPWFPFLGPLIVLYTTECVTPNNNTVLARLFRHSILMNELRGMPSTFYWGYSETDPKFDPPQSPPSYAKADIENALHANVSGEKGEPCRKFYLTSSERFQTMLRLPARLWLMKGHNDQLYFRTFLEPGALLVGEYEPQFAAVQLKDRELQLTVTDVKDTWRRDADDYLLRPSRGGVKLRTAVYCLKLPTDH